MQAITEAAEPQGPLLAIVKRWKLQWFGDTPRHSTLVKEILQGTVTGGRNEENHTKMDNIREWMGLQPREPRNAAHNRPG